MVGCGGLGNPVVNSVGMVLVPIPAANFQIGSPESEPRHIGNETQHLVKVTKPFYLSAYEVTQEQYKKVMGENPSTFSALGSAKDPVSGMDTSEFSVETVS